MEFRRKLKPAEIEVLGEDPRQRLHRIIDDALNRLYASAAHDTAEARVLRLMSDTIPIDARGIVDAHDAVHGEASITLNYVRSIIQKLYNAGLIERVEHGMYTRV